MSESFIETDMDLHLISDNLPSVTSIIPIILTRVHLSITYQYASIWVRPRSVSSRLNTA